ncbi:predicted protein [Lichtheimia corymbifera JMRC:FSU:9682]|uniref:Uncharacterized protein n=1 Tax=Lichtheimia corymbifera JMRC:FSU:9682 TaxID=1263082 RepID=A0A068RRF8_9FUNG|nr:predicted protein [Lichtheimia corymbifera JMRC:FSU:9682]
MFKASIDHVHPQLTTMDEGQLMVWACCGCNLGKWTRSVEECGVILQRLNETPTSTINQEAAYDLSPFLERQKQALPSQPWQQSTIEGLEMLPHDEWVGAKAIYRHTRKKDKKIIEDAASNGEKVTGTTLTPMEFEVLVRRVRYTDAWTGIHGTYIAGQPLTLSLNRKVNSSVDEDGTRIRHLHSLENCNVLLLFLNHAISDFHPDEHDAWLTRIRALEKIDLQAKLETMRHAMARALPQQNPMENSLESTSSSTLPLQNPMENLLELPPTSSSTLPLQNPMENLLGLPPSSPLRLQEHKDTNYESTSASALPLEANKEN